MDNDNDSRIDYPQDPGCLWPDDDDEFNFRLPECQDGLDNDNDGRVDYPQDPGCFGYVDDNENGGTTGTQNVNINANADSNVDVQIDSNAQNNIDVNQQANGGTQNVDVNADADSTVDSQIDSNAQNNINVNQQQANAILFASAYRSGKTTFIPASASSPSAPLAIFTTVGSLLLAGVGIFTKRFFF